MREARSRRHRQPNYPRIIGAVVILLLIIVGIIYAFTGENNNEQGNTARYSESGIELSENISHIMIMGVDKRDDDAGRSDTLMVAVVDKNAQSASLLSVPRDTRTEIEGHGFDKINHAYAYGDAALTRKTVENLMGIPMDYYIKIDTHAFERIIDALDGVDIDVEKRMYYEDPWDDDGGLVIDLYPGMQHLDGEKAIQYVRYRDGEGDIGRVNRQQHFMRAVLEKLLNPAILPKLPKIIEEVRGAVETDMPLDQMLSMAQLLPEIKAKGLKSEMLPGNPAYLADVSYWLPDIMKLREVVAKQMNQELTGNALAMAEKAVQEYDESLPKGLTVVAGTGEKTDKAVDENKSDKKDGSNSEASKKAATKADKPSDISVLVVNDSGINGAAAQVADVLRGKGFTVTGVETGKRSDRTKTIIVTDSSNTNWFYGMPFTCTIMDGGEPRQAVIYIGTDYGKAL